MKPFAAVEKVLSERKTPLKVFFRNDDGGWADKRLQQLADMFIEQDLPLDVAVIPDALSAESVDVIGAMLNADGRIAIHQHGFSHVNHQLSGRSCEFGSDRNYEQQHRDIAQGQEQLAAVFGSQVKPVFTPPWNRCTVDTAVALKSLGFQQLSRIINSEPLDNAIAELPVAVDWLKKRKGERLNGVKLVDYICGLFDTDDEVTGVMLHHEHMDQENRMFLQQLIETLRASSIVSFHSMMDIAVSPGIKPD